MVTRSTALVGIGLALAASSLVGCSRTDSSGLGEVLMTKSVGEMYRAWLPTVDATSCATFDYIPWSKQYVSEHPDKEITNSEESLFGLLASTYCDGFQRGRRTSG